MGTENVLHDGPDGLLEHRADRVTKAYEWQNLILAGVATGTQTF